MYLTKSALYMIFEKIFRIDNENIFILTVYIYYSSKEKFNLQAAKFRTFNGN